MMIRAALSFLVLLSLVQLALGQAQSGLPTPPAPTPPPPPYGAPITLKQAHKIVEAAEAEAT